MKVSWNISPMIFVMSAGFAADPLDSSIRFVIILCSVIGAYALGCHDMLKNDVINKVGE